MITRREARAADDLRALLRDEALPRLGLVDVGGGSRLAFELAVGATLAELDRLAAWERAGRPVDPGRWRQIGSDLVRLHRMATSAPHASSNAPT
jgi:hypothetical protein